MQSHPPSSLPPRPGTRMFTQLQRLRLPLNEAWEFFSNPRNLRLITPPELDFRVLGDPPPSIAAGTRIDYTVAPMFGMRLRWRTRIEAVEPPHRFVDVQEKGPYALWHHEHRFQAIDGGVEMRDTVTYRLPLHPLSVPAHALLVKPRLNAIFAFRLQALRERFGDLE